MSLITQIHSLLRCILCKLFEKEQAALELVKEGEEQLMNARRKCDAIDTLCKQSEYDCLSSVLLKTLNPAIELAPNLQLPYLIRSKVLAEMGRYKEAKIDAKKAQELNPGNKRGLVAEKLVVWMHQMQDPHSFAQSDEAKEGFCPLKDMRNHLKAACQSMTLCQAPPPSRTALSVTLQEKAHLLNEEDIGCQLCLDPLGDPITTPCGHTFCRNCLVSAMCYSKTCPLCRTVLPGLGFFLRKPVDRFVVSLSTIYFNRPPSVPDSCPSFSPQWIPIYHCPLFYPTSAASLHICEIPHRVMTKRVIETNGIFGVTLPPNPQSDPVITHGTLVKISHFDPLLSCDILPTCDGNLPRYVLQVSGLYRFAILETRLNEAGYWEGLAQRVEDIEVDDGIWNPKELENLVVKCRLHVKNILESLPKSARHYFQNKHGEMPKDPSDFSYWLAEFLPLNPYTTYAILPLDRVVDRLNLLCSWIEAASFNQKKSFHIG